MPRLIICEGVDSTGKSSLSKFLARKFDAVYMHASGHRDMYPAMDAHHTNMTHNIEVNMSNGHNVVVDRHWPSEHCYSTILRPALHAQYDFHRVVERISELNPTYIHCKSEVGWDRYQETHAGHDHKIFRLLNKDEYTRITMEYHLLFTSIPHVEYSIETWGADMDKFADEEVKEIK